MRGMLDCPCFDGPHSQVVRLGHPARLVPAVMRYSLDALISSSDSAAIIRDVRKEMEQAIVSVV